MPTSESGRHALREMLAETLGSETAGTLMEHIPPGRWDELATKDDLRELATKDELRQLATTDDLNALAATMATKDDLNKLAATMATKEDLRQTADLLRKETQADLKEMRGELKEGLGSLLARSADQQTQFNDQQARLTAEMTGQHRTTMLALLGVSVAVVASFLVPLLTSLSV